MLGQTQVVQSEQTGIVMAAVSDCCPSTETHRAWICTLRYQTKQNKHKNKKVCADRYRIVSQWELLSFYFFRKQMRRKSKEREENLLLYLRPESRLAPQPG